MIEEKIFQMYQEGYSFGTIVDQVVSEGYSQDYAVKLVDQVISGAWEKAVSFSM